MTYSNNWFDKHQNLWKKLLLPIIPENISVLELGSYEGRSSVWIHENIVTPKNGTIDCVDHWVSTQIESNFDENIKNTKIKKHKSKFLPFLLNAINNNIKYDLIYLDGDHTSIATLQNSILCWILLNNNGILIFDDYLWKLPKDKEDKYLNPKVGIDSFLSSYEKAYIMLHKNYQVIVQKNEKN